MTCISLKNNHTSFWFSVLGLDPERVGNDQDGDGFTIGPCTTLFIGNGPSICIAYVSSPAYTVLAERMKYILETYFTCNVQLYTGDYDRLDWLVVLKPYCSRRFCREISFLMITQVYFGQEVLFMGSM